MSPNGEMKQRNYISVLSLVFKMLRCEALSADSHLTKQGLIDHTGLSIQLLHTEFSELGHP